MISVLDFQAALHAQVPTPVPPVRQMAQGAETWSYPTGALRRAPQLTTSPRPIAVIGGAGGDPSYDLTYARSAVLRRDGRVLTYSSIGSRLFVFNPDGTPERTIGRQGQGPGEFMGASNIVASPRDTLILVDDSNRRINWVLPDRGVVGERSLAAGYHGGLHRAVGVLTSGDIIMTSAGLFRGGEAGRITRPPAIIAVLSPTTGVSRLLDSVPDLEMVMLETRYRGRTRMMPYPLRLGTVASVTVWDSLIVTSDGGARLQLRGFPSGVTRQAVLPGSRRPVTAAMRRAVVDRELAALRGPRREALVDPAESERIAREAPFADSLPIVGGLLVGNDGVLWVVDPPVPGTPGWAATGIRRDGAIIGRATGTDGMPMAFGTGTILLRREDSDGVVSLVLQRLVPRM